MCRNWAGNLEDHDHIAPRQLTSYEEMKIRSIAERLVKEIRKHQNEPGRFDVADAIPYLREAIR